MSWKGYCGICGPAIFRDESDQMRYKQGPHFENWRRACAASVGAVLLSDLQPKG